MKYQELDEKWLAMLDKELERLHELLRSDSPELQTFAMERMGALYIKFFQTAEDIFGEDTSGTEL